MNHVHIGPSPLALGLLVPCTLAAGFDVVLLGRPGASYHPEYVHVETGSGERVVRRPVAFEGPLRLADASDAVRSRVGSDAPLLLTCTLRDAIVDRVDLVAEALEARPPGAETVFAACENSPHSAYQDLEERFAAEGVTPVKTVIDRICREENDQDDEGRRVVLAHSAGEWLFEAPVEPLAVFEALSRVSEVALVKGLAAYRDRKLWIVNGAHLFVGLLARNAPVDEFDLDEPARRHEEDCERGEDLTETARRPEVIVHVSHLHTAMNEALERSHPDLPGNLAYGMDRVLAYIDQPDSARRVLSGFERAELAPFIATMAERIGRPAEICSENGCSVGAFLPVLDFFEDVVTDLDAFLDADLIRCDPRLVSEDADGRAVAAYRQFLEGWLPAAMLAERIERFEAALCASSPL